MKLSKLIRRFFVPSSLVTAIYWLKFGCKVSPKAEIELSPLIKIGQGTQISSFSKLKANDGPLIIGSQVSIGTNCFISADKGGVEIGDQSMVGPNVGVIGNNYRYDRLDIPMAMQEKTSKGIKIGSNVWIGVGSAILDGSEIDSGAIITPNSVVSGKVPENAIVQGNPAKIIFIRR